MKQTFISLNNKIKIIYKNMRLEGSSSNVSKIQGFINNIKIPHSINRKDFQINKIHTWKAYEYRTFFVFGSTSFKDGDVK